MITKIEHSENLFLSKLYFSNEDYKKSVLLTKMGVARSVGETTTLCDHTARSSVKTKFPIAEQRFLSFPKSAVPWFPTLKKLPYVFAVQLRCTCGAVAVPLRCPCGAENGTATAP